jgi:hypothetical protein
MSFDALFGLAGTVAMVCWACLIVMPRWPVVLNGVRYGAVGALSLAYAALVFVWFFRVEGGGFGSLAAVRALFQSDPVLLAGWIHYLAFDLFVGVWIAKRADAAGMGRMLQAPILAATFLFGPLGLLLFYGCRAVPALRPRTGDVA